MCLLRSFFYWGQTEWPHRRNYKENPRAVREWKGSLTLVTEVGETEVNADLLRVGKRHNHEGWVPGGRLPERRRARHQHGVLGRWAPSGGVRHRGAVWEVKLLVSTVAVHASCSEESPDCFCCLFKTGIVSESRSRLIKPPSAFSRGLLVRGECWQYTEGGWFVWKSVF